MILGARTAGVVQQLQGCPALAAGVGVHLVQGADSGGGTSAGNPGIWASVRKA